MADVDYDSGLPIRSEVDGTDERVQGKIVGGTSGTLGTTAAYQMAVDGDGNAHIEVHGNKAGGSSDVTMMLSGLGAVVPDGVYNTPDNIDPGNIGLVGMDRNATPADSQQTLRITAVKNTDGTPDSVRALDIALHDEAGNGYSPSNPVPVAVMPTEGGVTVHEENTEPALAKDTPTTWDYLVDVDDTFYLHQVLCAASGRARWELQIGDGAVSEAFTKKAVRFNSTAFPDPDITLSLPIKVVGTANGTHIRIISENKDNAVQDLSATLVGTLIVG